MNYLMQGRLHYNRSRKSLLVFLELFLLLDAFEPVAVKSFNREFSDLDLITHPNITSHLVRYRLCYGGSHSPSVFGVPPPPSSDGGVNILIFPLISYCFRGIVTYPSYSMIVL